MIVHGSFTIARAWKAAPARVFEAFASLEAKGKWFAPGIQPTERSFDFCEGGREVFVGQHPSGVVSRFDCLYRDIVPPAEGRPGRIVSSYVMHQDGKKISVSQACVQILPDGNGTRLVVREDGAFLDGYDDNGSREHGTNWLMDMLGKSVGEAA